jgi:hypothetical protein
MSRPAFARATAAEIAAHAATGATYPLWGWVGPTRLPVEHLSDAEPGDPRFEVLLPCGARVPCRTLDAVRDSAPLAEAA